jgi:sec-independent protein translocase protein TatC
MSFGEHLDELRRALIRATLGAAVGIAIGFWVATPLVRLLTRPLERAIVRFNQEKAADRILAADGYVSPEVQTVLDRREQTPRSVMVDVGQLITAIRSVSPDFLEHVDLQPWRFMADDFPAEHQQSVRRDLLEPLAGTDQAAGWLMAVTRHLLPSAQDQLKSVGDDALAPVLADACNLLLDQPGIANDPAFAGLLTPAEPGWFKRLFGKTELTPLQRMKQALDAEEQPDLRRLLNRSLVTVAFAGRIKPPELDLVRLELWENVDVRPQSLSPIEGFMIWMKAGLIAGLVISGPWIFYQLWLFVAAGLYPHEKKYVWVFLPISIALFVLGVLLVFVFVFDAVLAFFLGVNFNLGIDMQPRINDWLSFVLFLPLGFGLAFQLPLVMFFLNRIGVFSVAAYLSKWRIAVMVIFVVSMVLTPADPISMILLAVPLTFLYFFGVLLCKWFPGEVNPFSEATA